MDVRFINSFIQATQHVFKTTVAVDTHVGKPFLKKREVPDMEISAVIDLSGDAVGSVVLCFPRTTAVKVVSALTGADVTTEHPDFGDALGEMAKGVADLAKADFDGLNCDISPPTVLSDRDAKVPRSGRALTLVFPCASPLGGFSVEITMDCEAQAAAA